MAKRPERYVDLSRPDTLPQFLTPSEIIAILRCSRTMVYELLASGEIPSVRVGSRAIRIQTKDFLAWLARNKSTTPAA